MPRRPGCLLHGGWRIPREKVRPGPRAAARRTGSGPDNRTGVRRPVARETGSGTGTCAFLLPPTSLSLGKTWAACRVQEESAGSLAGTCLLGSSFQTGHGWAETEPACSGLSATALSCHDLGLATGPSSPRLADYAVPASPKVQPGHPCPGVYADLPWSALCESPSAPPVSLPAKRSRLLSRRPPHDALIQAVTRASARRPPQVPSVSSR